MKRNDENCQGKLGILLPGLGAVATTLIAGTIAVRKGIAQPVGSYTQMGNIRLGKRTDNRNQLIRDFVSLAKMDDLVFGGWDIFVDNAYQAASKAGVVDQLLLDQMKSELSAITPMKAVFDKRFVHNLEGTNIKSAVTKMDLADALMRDIEEFRIENGCDRMVMVWCASTEGLS